VENVLDWNGDHPHTNFKDLFNFLVGRGYFVEILGSDYSCVDPTNYGTVMFVDTEDVMIQMYSSA
jgi:membrane-bound transcription factor site-1 protease